jgi:outer membrane protein assembly factor BamC
MSLPRFVVKAGAVASAAALLAGCGAIAGPGKLLPDRQAEYRQARAIPPLEVPPDLASETIQDDLVMPELGPGGSATFSEYTGVRRSGPAAGRTAVLPQYEGLRIERDGDQRWLVVQAEAEQVWGRIRDFWLQEGFLISVEEPRVGVLETEWAENRADIPQDAIRRVIGRVLDPLYSAGTRDRFRVRIERGADPRSVEVYLTHRGAEEVVQGESTIWQARPSDPELEAEMLSRLMVYLGTEETRARALVAERPAAPATRADLVQTGDGEAFLRLREDFSQAWRRTGLALDRVGFTVEDRDRSQGVYYVRYRDPLAEETRRGWLSRMWRRGEAAERAAEYQVALEGDGGETQVTVRDKEGNPERSRTGVRILTLLHEQLQ